MDLHRVGATALQRAGLAPATAALIPLISHDRIQRHSHRGQRRLLPGLPLAAFWLLTANRESRVDIIHNLLLGFGLALTPLTSSAIMLIFFSRMKLGPRGLVEGPLDARSATPAGAF